MTMLVAPEKALFQPKSFIFLNENIYCGFSLEVSQLGTSNEYPNVCFCAEIRKNIMWMSLFIQRINVSLTNFL